MSEPVPPLITSYTPPPPPPPYTCLLLGYSSIRTPCSGNCFIEGCAYWALGRNIVRVGFVWMVGLQQRDLGTVGEKGGMRRGGGGGGVVRRGKGKSGRVRVPGCSLETTALSHWCWCWCYCESVKLWNAKSAPANRARPYNTSSPYWPAGIIRSIWALGQWGFTEKTCLGHQCVLQKLCKTCQVLQVLWEIENLLQKREAVRLVTRQDLREKRKA